MNFNDSIKAAIPSITAEQAEKFELYYSMLIDWNENRCNLTAITEQDEVITKHFADSVLPAQLIDKGARCIDVGTGAGFPGVPLLIMRPDIELVLVDSLQKRVDFLNELTAALGLTATAIHARAEDAGREEGLREKFDIALTRAVSQTNILLEWTSPFLKIGGKSLMYKSQSAETELQEAKNALSVLGLDAKIVKFDAQWGERSVICAKKLHKTPNAYPRKAGTAKKKPL